MRMFRTLKCLNKELFILRFPTLGALLAYLKQCAKSSLQDAVVKSESSLEMSELNDEITNDHVWASDPIEEAEYRHELWEAIQRHLADEEERNVFYDSYVLGLKAPEIMARYPRSFTEVMEVFRIRARILRRLRKDPGLWRFLN
jgi:DNA-directed RNA polymerase specialized sigma24 family protein